MAEIGFIGLGVMGCPMAACLARGGHRVRAHDIDPEAVRKAAADGCRPAASAADAAREADFAITMLPLAEHVEQVLFGPAGVVQTLPPSALVIDMSTVAPAAFDRMAQRMEEAGRRMMDAPVGRTSQNAAQGTLLIMAGGSPGEVEEARPALECMGDKIILCGGRGMGMRAKMINNYLSIVSNVAVAETLTAAERAGLERETALEVLLSTAAGQGHLSTTYPAQVLAGDLEPGFMVDLAFKDLGLALAMGEELSVGLGMGEEAMKTYQAAREQGRGRQDWTAVFSAVRQLNGLPPAP